MGLPPMFLPVPDMTMLGEEDTEAVLLPLTPPAEGWGGGGDEKGKAEGPLRPGVEEERGPGMGVGREEEVGEDALGAKEEGALEGVGMDILPTAGLSLPMLALLLLLLLLLMLLVPPPPPPPPLPTGIGLATRKSTP